MSNLHFDNLIWKLLGNYLLELFSDLISKVRDIVFKKTKVNLELEVKIIGQNKWY